MKEINTCPCGIAQNDCIYHQIESIIELDDYVYISCEGIQETYVFDLKTKKWIRND